MNPPRLHARRTRARRAALAVLCALCCLPAACPAAGRGLKPYDEVVTGDAVTTEGLFKVHRLGDRVLYEIPPDRLGWDMLWYTEVAKVPAGVGLGGLSLGSRCVRWERLGDRVYLKLLSFGKRAEVGDPGSLSPIQRAVQEASMPTTVMAFEVEAEGSRGAPVIDVTRLLTTNVDEFSAEEVFTRSGISVKGADGRPSVDASRSYVDSVKVFPRNVEARSSITFRIAPPGIPDPVVQRPPSSRSGNLWSATILVHYSLTLLPERPMRPRLADPRLGYYVDSYEDYSGGENRVWIRHYINRFQLQKKDPQAELSEPLRPIVFYIGRQVPEKWRPYIRQAVEDWRPAFEAAGFLRAIEVRDAPTEAEDPSWDPEDTRYSVIRWAASPLANALGPTVHDPRSGQILSATIFIYQDILRIAQQWYFSMCAPLDPRARRLPFPDDLKGEILRYIVAHEVGHAIGLRHNHKASSAFTVEQLRDPDFTARYGTVASITSYGRFNYVAQPEDGVTHLMPKIGPYDLFAVEWGYRPLPEAASPEDEKPALDRMAARQVDEPWLRYGGEDGPAQVDPTVKVQCIGSDPIRTVELGLKNLDRTADLLLSATTRPGEDFTELKDAYLALLDTRNAWLASVANVVGGVVENRTLAGRGGAQFERVPKEEQRRAVRFLLETAMKTPAALARPELLNQFRYYGVSEPWMQRARQRLEDLLCGKRYRLLRDAEALDPAGAYTLAELFADVQAGLFEELAAQRPEVTADRRELQRFYLAHLETQLAAGAAARRSTDAEERSAAAVSLTETDLRAVVRSSIAALARTVTDARKRAAAPATLAHLEDLQAEIRELLEGGR